MDHAARSVLILPNSLHHLRIERGRMAFLYVDPLGRDLEALIARMTNTTPRAAFDLREEPGVIEIMTGLAESRIAPQDGRASLGELLGVGTRGKTSARIAAYATASPPAPVSETCGRTALPTGRLEFGAGRRTLRVRLSCPAAPVIRTRMCSVSSEPSVALVSLLWPW